MTADTVEPRTKRACAIKRAKAFLEEIRAGLPSHVLYDRTVECLRAELESGGLSLTDLKITEEDLASFAPGY